MPHIVSHLHTLFGFKHFRAHQEDVVRAILAGRDTFTLMPTGGGKSLCYQLPAHIMNGTCVVISPLLSLMKDQVDAARATGLRAWAYNSAVGAVEKRQALAAIRSGDADLLYISPERLRHEEFLTSLRQARLAFFAVDEAHCISQWGHDFRPDYLALSRLRELFPGTPLAAFTATATSRVADDIMDRLKLESPLLTRASFNRPNLFYQVTPKENLTRQLLAFLREHEEEAGIIYRTTRKDVENTVKALQAEGVSCLAYHAGMDDASRAAAQEAFRHDRCRVIVATIAFGMGIDKSNVRFVLHGDLPKNLEGYYQETGRAGRDGEPARCVLFHNRQDIAQLMRFTESVEDETVREAARTQLYRMLDFTQKEGCRRKSLLAYFGEDCPGDDCGGCDICTGEVEREDARESAQKLLSAMVRTECRFGATQIIDIVRGARTQKIRQFGHDRLPTYGVGHEHNSAYWYRVMDAMLAQGLAVVPDPDYPCPAITERGWQVLRGSRPFTMLKAAEATKKGKKTARIPEDVRHPGLYDKLRQERSKIAVATQVPPYVVFADKSLKEMASLLPDSPEKLLDIHGVGQHKLDKYGDAFLKVITTWLAENSCHADNNPDAASRI